MRPVAVHSEVPVDRRRQRIPWLLVRDLLAVGLLTTERPSARRRLERELGAGTGAALRRAGLSV